MNKDQVKGTIKEIKGGRTIRARVCKRDECGEEVDR